MEHQKILNLLNEANDCKFVTNKWNMISDNSKANYGVGNQIIYNSEVLKSTLCDYNDYNDACNRWYYYYRTSSNTSSI